MVTVSVFLVVVAVLLTLAHEVYGKPSLSMPLFLVEVAMLVWAGSLLVR
jgi:hypothetical protein